MSIAYILVEVFLCFRESLTSTFYCCHTPVTVVPMVVQCYYVCNIFVVGSIHTYLVLVVLVYCWVKFDIVRSCRYSHI